MNPEINRHHVFYEKRIYQRSHLYRRLRNLPGLYIPMHVNDHRRLHTALDTCNFGRTNPSVPFPAPQATQIFLNEIVLPYDPEGPRTQTLDQAIGWFAMTGNLDTADHLHEQREFILRTPLEYILPRTA